MRLLASQRGIKAEPWFSSGGGARDFARAEDGNLTIFGLMMASLMIAFGGLAVDMMRYEATRAALQNTLDRSALAAASFSQSLVPEDVVTDYFDKAGLSDQLVGVTATQGLNFRRVVASAEADTLPFFLNMVGLQQLHVAASSAAEQRITNVEVMLVLDVSGSMASNNKMTNLKAAASEFVDTVLANDVENKISIGIVPFNGQVNLGATVLDQFNATQVHGAANVNCVDLPASVYAGSAMSTTLALPMTADADTYSGASSSNAYSSSSMTPNAGNKWCPPQPTNIVRLPSQNVTEMQTNINAMAAVGATSINAGLKWGLALMDPALRPTYATLMAASEMPDTLVDRPFDFDDDEAMKVIVLMTDGEHFAEERVVDAYKTGPSPIYKSTPDSYYSIFHAGQVDDAGAATICASRPYWVPHLTAWHSRPWNGTTPASTDCYGAAVVTANTSLQSWPQVWSSMRLHYVAWQFYGRALGGTYATWVDTFRTRTPTTDMDTQLQGICAQAKANGVIVYGIAFEAPTNGQTQIRGCSTSDAHYFDASGVQITSAFRAIANNISQLRLTQ